MDCPKCQGLTKVLDTRQVESGLKRRRKCLECDFRFTTHEQILKYSSEQQEERFESARNERRSEQSEPLPLSSIWNRVHSSD